MEIIFRKHSLKSLYLAIGIFIVIPSAIIWAADPCQIFHRPFSGIFHHGLSGDTRCQTAGLINTYLQDPREKFDSVLMGSSFSSNFKTERLAKNNHLNRTLQIGMPGLRPIEQQFIMERALDVGKVSHVFWEIFPFQFFLFPQDTAEKIIKLNEFPAYLYNKSRIDDYRYVFNRNTLQATVGVFRKLDYYNVPDIARYGYWEHSCTAEKTCQPFYDSSRIAQLLEIYSAPHFTQRSDQEISSMDFSAADRYLLSTILPYCNQSLQFDLFFPPLSFLWYAQQDPQNFYFQLYMLRYVVNKTKNCSNIRVFAFNNEQWISGDLAHYHDPRHFYGGVHDYIIDSMATGKHIITLSNVETFERQFITNVNSYMPWASTAAELANSPH